MAEQVRFDCDADQGILSITSVKGEPRDQAGDVVDLWSLLTVRDERVIEVKTVERMCNLAGENYRVVIVPIPGNANIQGRCGAEVFAGVEIYKGKSFWSYSFREDCHYDEKPIQELRLRSGANEPEIVFQPVTN